MTTPAAPHIGQRSKPFLLSMFFALYFVQGMVFAFSRTFLKPYLDQNGIPVGLIGTLAGLLLLPFILKVFVGMLSDRVNLFGMGHRKPYIILGIISAAICFALAGLVPPATAFVLFATLIFLGSFSVSLFDTATDGLAVEITPTEDHSTVQGAMVAGRAVGFIVLAALFGFLVESVGYRSMFIASGLFMLIPLFWVFNTREPAPTENPESANFNWGAFSALAKPTFFVFALYAIAYSIVSSGVDGLVTLFMQSDFNAAEGLLGTWSSLRGVGSVIGALIGALLIRRFGRIIVGYVIIAGISIMAVVIGLASSVDYLLTVAIVWGIVWAIQETIFFVFAMDLTDTRIAATMFAMMMAVSNIGQAIGDGVPTALTETVPFQTVFIGLGAMGVVTAACLTLMLFVAPQLRKAKPSA